MPLNTLDEAFEFTFEPGVRGSSSDTVEETVALCECDGNWLGVRTWVSLSSEAPALRDVLVNEDRPLAVWLLTYPRGSRPLRSGSRKFPDPAFEEGSS